MKKLDQFRKEKDRKIKTHRRVFSRVIAKKYLGDLKRNTMNYVEASGFFVNEIVYRLSAELLPKLLIETSTIATAEAKLVSEAEGTFHVM